MKKSIVILVLLMSVRIYALDVIFRYDDFKLQPSAIQDSLTNLFAEVRIPLHVAIIPFSKDSTPILDEAYFQNNVKPYFEKGILQIALHGFCHKGETRNGEFLDKNYEEQLHALKNGSHLLDSIFCSHIHIFIPPWNRYNQITQDILSDLEFNIISGDIADSRFVYDSRFQYYPEGIDHPSKLPEILRLNAKRAGLIVCMFHEYDFNENFTINDLREMLKDISLNTSLRFLTMDQLASSEKSFNAERITANLKHPLLTKILKTRSIILPVATTIQVRIWDVIIHLLLVFFITLVGFIILPSTSKCFWVGACFVSIYAVAQTWFQFVMPKVGICIIAFCTFLVICIEYLYQLKIKQHHIS